MNSQEWIDDCNKWRGKVLTGRFAHWCCEWDELPVDETTMEITSCRCYEGSEFNKAQGIAEAEWEAREERDRAQTTIGTGGGLYFPLRWKRLSERNEGTATQGIS